MPIDPSIILRGVAPDIIGSAARGFQLGQSIRDAPLLRKQRQQTLARGEQQSRSERLKLGQDGAVAINSIIGDATAEQITPDSFQQSAVALQSIGVPLAQEDLQFNPVNVGRLVQLSQAGKGFIASQRGGASARAFAPQTVKKVVGQDESGEDITQLFSRQLVFDPNTQESKAVLIPIEGDLVLSSGETITQKRFNDIQQKQDEEQAKETGKALGAAKSAPLIAKTRSTIESAVKLAVAEATERGEVLTDLRRSEAALPGLRNAVDQLKELAPIATSTLGGRLFDTAVKESGFGSTKGANARAKFISIVSNQVLPLLKPTFGGSFSVQEGEELKASFADPNASPTQKVEQLSAFIDQKVRTIQEKQRQLEGEITSTEELTTGIDPAQGIPTITSQAEFDALPAGTTYQQANGERFVK